MPDDFQPDDAAVHEGGHSNFRDHVGYEVAEWREGFARVRVAIDRRHLNRRGVLHGGVITTIVDAAGGYAGTYCPYPGRVRKSATVSLTTQFVAQCHRGVVTAEARLRGGGRRIFFAAVEVTDERGRLIATGEAVYKLQRGSETLEGVPIEA